MAEIVKRIAAVVIADVAGKVNARKIVRITMGVLLLVAAAAGTSVAVKRLHRADSEGANHSGVARQPRFEDLYRG